MPTVVLFDEPFSLDSFIIVVSIEGDIFFYRTRNPISTSLSVVETFR